MTIPDWLQKPRLVILDVDGTMAESQHYHFLRLKSYLRTIDKPLPELLEKEYYKFAEQNGWYPAKGVIVPVDGESLYQDFINADTFAD